MKQKYIERYILYRNTWGPTETEDRQADSTNAYRQTYAHIYIFIGKEVDRWTI